MIIDPTNKQLTHLKVLINSYEKNTNYPETNNWQSLSNNDIWLWVVGQVMVVGSSAGSDRFFSNSELKKKLNFNSLKNITSESERKQLINSVLREAGVRYASRIIDNCKKSSALAHNLDVGLMTKNNFKGLLSILNDLKAEDIEIVRVHYIMRHFKYFKSKSARDFLMNMGINRNTLAIDIRIQNVLKGLGIQLPSIAQLSDEYIYRDVELQLINKICIPLNIEPIKLDRILYQNYSHIVKQLNHQ